MSLQVEVQCTFGRLAKYPALVLQVYLKGIVFYPRRYVGN